MARAAHNVSRQRSRGNAIIINGLLTWRARRLRDVRLKPNQTAETQADIAAIDRVLVNVIDFTGDIKALTRDSTREALFRRGELQRMVSVALREANRSLTTREITTIVIHRKGLTMERTKQARQWVNRVRKVC